MKRLLNRKCAWLLTSWLLLLTLCVAPVGASGSVQHGPPGQADFAHRFTSGDPSTGAMFRWWWPGATVDDAELVKEVKAIAAAGYHGVEISDSMDSVDYAIDPDLYGYGTPRWNHAVEVVLTQAKKSGIEVDITLGAHWPAAVPGLPVDGDATSKELTYGTQLVTGGASFSGPVPAPAPLTYQDRTSVNGVIISATKTSVPQFVAVNAYRCLADTCSTLPLAIDLTSAIDLTAQVSNGNLSWTPPDSHTWVVVSNWYRGTAQRNDAPFGTTNYLFTDPESRVIDHFSAAGATAFINYFNSLLSSTARTLLKQTGGAFFEDSLELTFAQAWTPTFVQEFATRRGYSLTPYLGLLSYKRSSSPFGGPSPVLATQGADAAVAARVLRDVQQTINDLYFAYHVAPIQKWANSLGLRYRAQPYGQPIDLAQAAATIDNPECESLGCGTRDDWRIMASGADMAGHQVLSDELLPGGFSGAYGVTKANVASLVNSQFALGSNLMVFHGFNYSTWPTSVDGTRTDSSALWPGFASFSAGIGEPMGPRQPSWGMETDSAGYYARMQSILQTGRRQTDVAVYNQTLGHIADAYPGTFLLDLGYSYGYVTPATLSLPNAKVSHGVLAADGPVYKALVINNQASMPIDSAKTILGFAKRGLPIIVVGSTPSTTPGYGATAASVAAGDAQLQALMTALLAQPSVRQVASTTDVPAALAAVGANPAVSTSTTGLRTVHRVDGGTDFYYVYNSGSSAVSANVTLSGKRGATPSVLDAWAGTVTPVAKYTSNGNNVTVGVSLAAGEATVIALGLCDGHSCEHDSNVHVVSTTADGAVSTDGSVVIRASAQGTYETVLSNGRTVTSWIGSVPAATTLSTWNLAVDEWSPGGPTDSSSVTTHTAWNFNNIALVPWSAIPQITDAVGIGTYTTTVTLPQTWRSSNGAYLNLGTVNGTFRISVNGKWVGAVSQLQPSADIGDYLKAGTNTITVTVATTLLNRLRITRPADFGRRAKQDIGLIGPVTLTPYGQAVVVR